MQSLVESDSVDNKYMIEQRVEGDNSNLFRKSLLQIFPKVTTITIGTSTGDQNNYIFSLLSLLSLIETSGVKKVLIIGGDWLDWNSHLHWKQESKEMIQQRYEQAKYNINIEMKQEEDNTHWMVYHCVIEKK